MHYHLEVIMPPTDNVSDALEEILRPFDENKNSNSNAFWDWYVVGGRWSGAKTRAKIGEEKIDAFVDEMKRRKVTVSGLQFGKQELSPESQIPEVDALWREMCPGGGDQCLIFKHAGDNLDMDICKLSDVPPALTAGRVIIAAPNYKGEELEAVYMLSQDIWNGVTHQDTTFKGGVLDAVKEWEKKSETYKEEYRKRVLPQDDWLCVTVDYRN